MVTELDVARRYRADAEALRRIADSAITPRIGAALYKIAADYDRMAISLEAIRQSGLALDTPASAVRFDGLTRAAESAAAS